MERTDKGVLMVPRAFFDSKIWQAARTFSECEAWLDLLQSARFEASPTTSRIGSYEVTWGPGQYPASIRFLARKWGRSPQWVRTFLGKMRRAGWISTDDSQGVCVITVAGRGKDDTPHTPNKLDDSELQRLATHLASLIAEKVAGNGAEKQHTSNTNNRKEEEMSLEKPPKGGKETPPRADAPSPRFAAFTEWLRRNAPSVLKMQRTFTEEEFGRLRLLYGFDELEHVLTDMENKADLCRRYKSAYLTCRKWLERDYGKRTADGPSRQDERTEAWKRG